MKKIILALFLLFGFANAEPSFTVTDSSGYAQTVNAMESVSVNLDDKKQENFSLEAKKIESAYYGFFLNNTGKENLLVRFSTAQGNIIGDTQNRQILFKAGAFEDFFVKPYIAATSCQVDKSANNRATDTFFIANAGKQTVLFFYVRDCKTGEIENVDNKISSEVDFDASFLATKTSSSEMNTDYRGDGNSGSSLRLRTVIIAKEATRRLAIDYGAGHGEEFICKDNKLSNANTIKLFDGRDNDITDKVNLKPDLDSTDITFTIPNDDAINYQKMYFEITCINYKNGKLGIDGMKSQESQRYYFDARPKEIQVSGLPNESDWLYAEYEYNSDGSSYVDEFSRVIKDQLGSFEGCPKCKVVENNLLEQKTMNTITLKAVDNNGVKVENFTSHTDVSVVGKIYGDGENGTINELSDDRTTLNRACAIGSKEGCAIATAVIDKTGSKIYTHINNNGQEVLSYNNAGKTVLYGVDTKWTAFSQEQGRSINPEIQKNGTESSILCANGESHNDEKPTMIAGKSYDLIGCYIPFVNPDSTERDFVDFYEFRPAVYNLVFDSKNSPANESYGTDKFTYMRTISENDFEFEAADFNASILAIGASLDSLEQGRALSHYDNHLKVADKLKFSGSPVNPTIELVGTSKQNDIATDFSVTISDDESDVSGALIVTLEPKDPYDHEKGYKDETKLTEIKSKEDLVISRDKDEFYAGKNLKASKLNFKREDLLARSYIHLGLASVNIDITDPKNEELSKKITDEKAAFVFSYKGDDINIIDAAIIAPNLASNETTTDGAVYLAGYCEPTSRATCKESGVFISNTIAGHMNYFGFDFLAYGKHDTDVKESTTDSLFEYSGASFAQFKRGADFLSSFEANEVKIMLKGDQAEDYCKIFRNCYKLENGKFGTTFNSYKASITPWHGSGDKQGKTIVDSIANDSKKTRRKEQRLSF